MLKYIFIIYYTTDIVVKCNLLEGASVTVATLNPVTTITYEATT